jgi:ABC-2 type transport system ATP-binding protein
MQALADDVVIVAAGRLVRQGSVGDVIAGMAGQAPVEVRTPEPDKLATALEQAGAVVTRTDVNTLLVSGPAEDAIGNIALMTGVAIHRLSAERADLEDAFLELTHGKAGIR